MNRCFSHLFVDKKKPMKLKPDKMKERDTREKKTHTRRFAEMMREENIYEIRCTRKHLQALFFVMREKKRDEENSIGQRELHTHTHTNIRTYRE